jgi:hypothetical protein
MCAQTPNGIIMKTTRFTLILASTTLLFAMLFLFEIRRSGRDTPDAFAGGSTVSEDTVAELEKRIRRLEEQLISKDEEINRLKAGSGRDVLPTERDSSEHQVVAMPVNRRSAVETFRKKTGDTALEENRRKKMEKQRELHRAARIERRYADLMNEFNLGPGEADHLRALLMDREKAVNGISGSDLSRQTQAEEALRAYLGEEGYAYLKWYEETTSARAAARSLQVKLASHDLVMTREQREHMVDVFHRIDVKGKDLGLPHVQTFGRESGGFEMTMQVISSDQETGHIEESLDAYADNLNRVIAEAEGVLSEEQLEIMANHLNQVMREKENQAEIARTLLQPSGPAGESMHLGEKAPTNTSGPGVKQQITIFMTP